MTAQVSTPVAPSAGMLGGASNFGIHGGDFKNAGRDNNTYVFNIGVDPIEVLHKALPMIMEESRKIHSQSNVGDNAPPAIVATPTQTEPLKLPLVPADRSVAEMYTRSLLKHLAGYPLYEPQLYNNGDLSDEYRHGGVRVGDVGIIRGDGAFDFLFNICPSQNGSINPSDLPKDFTLEASEDTRIKHSPRQFPRKTHIFQSPVNRSKNMFGCAKYTCVQSWGAILELPEGAIQEEAISAFPFKRLAACYAKKWYEYTIRNRGRDVVNGSLYLVTSCTKCVQWGIAVYDLPGTPQDTLRFVHDRGIFSKPSSKYRWKGPSAVTTKVTPSPDVVNNKDSPNQCVLLQGHKIMISQDVFDNLVNDLLRPELSSSSPQAGSSSTQQPAERIRGGVGSDPANQRAREPATEMVTLQTNSNQPPVHPADLLNTALLSLDLGAKVAISHDNDWCDLLEDLGKKDANPATVAQLFMSIVDNYGCISLTGTKNKSLVIAVDVGTTLSGVSYVLLEKGIEPRIHPVTRFAGQRGEGGNSKVPSVICYDQHTNIIAVGSATDTETSPELFATHGVRCAEWFKLRMRPPDLAADELLLLQKFWSLPEAINDDTDETSDKDDVHLGVKGDEGPVHEPPLPVSDDFKKPVDVFADFLLYLFRYAKEYIVDTERNRHGTFSWASVARNIDFIITHPNGWEGEQQEQIREAAVKAGLVDSSVAQKRIALVTEGEANLYFCLDKNVELRKERGGILVADCGGGTIDLSAYSQNETGVFREIVQSKCLLQGSVFVTSRARDYFKERFRGSKFGSDGDIEVMVRAFDMPGGVKRMFNDPNLPYCVKFGCLHDDDQKFGISNGKFSIEGAQMANFFEPAVQGIILGIEGQCDEASRGGTSIRVILLVGGFGSSDYLYARLKDHFQTKEINVLRPDTGYLNKAVADGALSFYLNDSKVADS